MSIKATFLGTGTSQGVPVIACDCEVCRSPNPHDHRLRSSMLVESNSLNLVIDAGPDFRQQMLRAGIRSLDGVLLTHNHKDHTGGLDDVRAFNYRQKGPVDVYARQSVLEALRIEFSYAFEQERYPGVPEIRLMEIRNEPFHVKGLEIIPIEVMHHKLPAFGFRIGPLVYITDASRVPESELSKIEGCKVLVINALRKKLHYSHFNLEQALDIIRLVKPSQAYLTHISHMMGMEKVISRELPAGVAMAWDGLTFEVDG